MERCLAQSVRSAVHANFGWNTLTCTEGVKYGTVTTATRAENIGSTFIRRHQSAASGYTALYIRHRLDLTVEAMVVKNPQWHSLFTDEELKKARKRLMDYGYNKHSN